MAIVLIRGLRKTVFSTRIWSKKHFSSLTYHPCNVALDHRVEHTLNKYKLTYVFPKQINGICKYSDDKKSDKPSKMSLFQKFKQMYKEYWYVLVPVHLITSTVWFGGFYYMAKSGIDIVHILETWHVSEKVLNPLRDSSMGYLAVAYACYKIATPARYTVTLGGTTISINYLKKWGYIKPVPSAERMKEIYQEKKETITKSVREGIKEKKETFMDSLHETKEGIKEKKDHLFKSVKQSTENKKNDSQTKG
ncbi:uncharacterized protein C18orf19 homolog A [Diorhabda sublineata]|uniref:uncharacterized protein C18orf19 homolog A n=1 Tax=Diorhabda sublineata TaxID=1163346 RepID=UPI0024E0AEE9|nr:uncharacterized protein C18orf19 homolog A [Diorhabda sublineata]